MKKYNHAFDIAFSIDSDNEGDKVTYEELLAGLLKRVAGFIENPSELIEGCGCAFDTYYNEG